MTSLADLTRAHSSLDRDDVDHLHRLVAEWAFLADLCFADLLLYVQAATGKWLVIDQVRPATNQTVYVTDYIGTWASDGASTIERAATEGIRVEGNITLPGDLDDTDTGHILAIPVSRGDRVIAVITKEWVNRAGRTPGELEHN